MTPQDLIAAFDVLADAPDGTKRLRELVLSLAVRGKLVEQDPKDEPAHTAASKARRDIDALHAAGEITRPKATAQLLAADAPHVVPSSWCWVRLGEVVAILDHRREPIKSEEREARVAGTPESSLYPYYGATQQAGWIDAYRFDEELVLLGEDGAPFFTDGKHVAYVVDGKFWVNNHAHALRMLAGENRYLCHVLNATDYEGFVAGTTRLKLTQGRMIDLPVPLPPLAEQLRIVARVDELMGLLDRLEAARYTRDEARRAARDAALADLRNAPDPEAVETAWTRVAQQMDDLFTEPEDVAPLRQEVLQLAVQGRLTGDNVEEVMLNDLVDPKRPVSYGVLVPGPDVKGGVPLVRIADLDDRRPAPTTGKSISPKVAEQYSRVRLHGDELLLGVVGSIGKVGVASPAWKGAVVARAVVRMGIRSEVHRDYVCYALQSPGVQRYFSDSTRTLAQPTLNVGLIRATPIPLPARDAQENIVSTVDALMSLCDNLESRLTSARDLHGQFASAAVHHLDI